MVGFEMVTRIEWGKSDETRCSETDNDIDNILSTKGVIGERPQRGRVD